MRSCTASRGRFVRWPGEPFWTLIAEAKVEKIDDFFSMEQKLMANEVLGKAMADYHDLVVSGRREIYRIES